MSNPLQMFEISPEEISNVVSRFYARIRQHPDLGPVFAAHIDADEWPAHEEKIAAFWRNAILKERGYDGQPMRVHLQTPEIQPEHFAQWLGLFDEVLQDTLSPELAQAFSALAHRIGNGFRYGIEQIRRPADLPPMLG
ncbi:group III truncated hemoglobin [Shimia thalassica]|uniref:group III truncated hemoglobin n=1 Tax=Shimia thalassica TaxID=1715693 RepID=UPI0026E45D18|nr:group III truncated hemoglobin [Shimia thalassica]MDO6799700.1 group III truncated hemoglobin [Shimia thalassica]